MNLQDVSDAFNIQASPEPLSGGSQPTFKVGNVVLKRVKETSLENNHSPELIQWIAEFSQALKQDGFRFPKALQTKEGKWITPDGWTAWTVVEGRHSTKEDVVGVIEGIVAFHRALAGIQKNPLMDENQTAWGKADRWCWGEKPEPIHPVKWRNVHFTASRPAAVSAGRPPGGVLRRVSRAQRRLHSPG